jgi:acylphosphatase
MEQVTCTISGKVQNVFLRSYIKECADKYGLVGFVRNLENGNVEVVAEGGGETIAKFLADVRRGSTLSVIETVDTVWSHARHNFDHFLIKSE